MWLQRKQAFGIEHLDGHYADFADLRFRALADAAWVCACGRRIAAMRPKSWKRSLLVDLRSHIQTALSLHCTRTRRSRTKPTLDFPLSRAREFARMCGIGFATPPPMSWNRSFKPSVAANQILRSKIRANYNVFSGNLWWRRDHRFICNDLSAQYSLAYFLSDRYSACCCRW